MIAKLRFLLVCMIMLALPVQGIAAATMRFCAAAKPSQAAHVHAAQATHHHGMHAPPSGAAHHHHERSLADAGDAHAKDATTQATVKCSVCAACCMAAAPAPAIPTLHPVEVGTRVTLPAALSYVGPVADGLERPPRSLLA